MNFNEWLDVFVEEKGIDKKRPFEFFQEGTWNYIPIDVIIDFVKQLPNEQKNIIKDTLVKIDFVNGNIYHYFRYLAKGIARL